MKKPILVQLIGLFFIFSPFLSVVMTLRYLNQPEWYTFSAVLQWIVDMELMDQVWIGLLLISGVGLNFPSRFSWMLALGSILTSLTLNLFRAANDVLSQTGSITFPLMSLLSAVSLFFVIYYFRYPYLDRREAWWGIHERYEVDLPCRLLSHGGIKGRTQNLSLSGMLFEVLTSDSAADALPKVGDLVEVEIDMSSGPSIKGRLVRVTESGHFGIQFDDLRSDAKNHLKKYFSRANAIKA